MNQALKPNYFSEFSSLESLKVEDTQAELDPKDHALFRMAKSTGWKVFKALVDDVTRELDEAVKSQMASGADYEVIGQSTVAKELTKDVIRKLITRVEDVRESVDAKQERDSAGGDS